jgi:transcriptional regulator with XRE-family HTH domain
LNRRGVELAVEIGGRIRRRRLAEGMSQEVLATQAGVHRTTVISIEKGRTVMNADTLLRIAGGLGVTPVELAGGIEWIPTHPAPSGRWRFDPPPEGPGP